MACILERGAAGRVSRVNRDAQPISQRFLGLMQLLVPTGRMIARKHEGKITRRRLQDPDINVTLGTHQMSETCIRPGRLYTLPCLRQSNIYHERKLSKPSLACWHLCL